MLSKEGLQYSRPKLVMDSQTGLLSLMMRRQKQKHIFPSLIFTFTFLLFTFTFSSHFSFFTFHFNCSSPHFYFVCGLVDRVVVPDDEQKKAERHFSKSHFHFYFFFFFTFTSLALFICGLANSVVEADDEETKADTFLQI